MTHYPLLVTLPGSLASQDVQPALHAALAPFNENTEVEPYFDANDEETTYNPRSKWDWWSVGGRFSGHFWAKPGADSHPNDLIHVDYRGVFGDEMDPTQPGQVDGGRKRALDLQRLRDEAATRAEAAWNEYASVVFGTPTARAWKSFVDQIGTDGYTIEDARTDYHAQPRIEAIQKHDAYKQAFVFNPHDEFDPFTRDEYVTRMVDHAVLGYATLDTVMDGGWIAPGEMGWFGMSSETPRAVATYGERMRRYIDKLDDEDWLVFVDCHI